MFTDIIFDFDGTISDTYPVYAEALLKILESHGLCDTYDSVMAKLKVSVGYALQSYDWGSHYREISKEFHSLHAALAVEKQQPIEGADVLLKAIADSEKRSYIYTHTDMLVYKLLFRMGIINRFTDIMDGSMKFPRKPCPDALNWFIERHRLDRSKTIIVGDRDIDIDAGHNAGIAGCLFDPDGFYPNAEADFKVSKLTDIIQIL